MKVAIYQRQAGGKLNLTSPPAIRHGRVSCSRHSFFEGHNPPLFFSTSFLSSVPFFKHFQPPIKHQPPLQQKLSCNPPSSNHIIFLCLATTPSVQLLESFFFLPSPPLLARGENNGRGLAKWIFDTKLLNKCRFS